MTYLLPVAFVYYNNFIMLPEDQLADFLEDNQLEDTEANRRLITPHFIYYTILHKIYDISLPFYVNYNTPYIPQTPPRTFSSFFTNLDLLWCLTKQAVNTFFTYSTPPQHPHKKPIQKLDPYAFIYNTKKHPRHQIEKAEEYMLEHAVKFQDEIWLKQDNLIFPYSLCLRLATLTDSIQPNSLNYETTKASINILDLIGDYEYNIKNL